MNNRYYYHIRNYACLTSVGKTITCNEAVIAFTQKLEFIEDQRK